MSNPAFSSPSLIQLTQLLDLTDLSENCSHHALDILCQRARTTPGPIAAICIWPQFVQQAKEYLSATTVHVATVINFPNGDSPLEQVIRETRQSLADHADEIDLVMPYKAFLKGDRNQAREMIEAIVDITQGQALLKIILESGLYPDQNSIAQASNLAIECGADFLKTSTGKAAVSATPQAAKTMLEVIKTTGGVVGFKAAGGIRTLQEAKTYLDLARSILGEEWIKPENFRFGASSLLDAIEAQVTPNNSPALHRY